MKGSNAMTNQKAFCRFNLYTFFTLHGNGRQKEIKKYGGKTL